MKNNSALPGGSLKSKPTWSNACGCSATSAFFVLGDRRHSQPKGEVLMIEQDTLVAKPSEFIPTNRTSFKSKSPDHKRSFRNAPKRLERQVADRAARLTPANEQLTQEIKEHRRAEDPEKSDVDSARPPSDYGQNPSRTTVIVVLACIVLGCATGTFLGTKTGEMGFSIVFGASFGMVIGTLGRFLYWVATMGR
jgi:hypothetical protein